ncbi:MAG TPA: protein translocase subunit SecF [Nocardioidaceae bacterium]|nr:protein translocase subunit SecF [Nocardioidaceae bacterium]
MSRFTKLGKDLYEGEVSVDFVGRTRIWYTFSAIILIVATLGLTLKGLNWGIEFEGGVEYKVVVAGGADQDDVDAVREAIVDVAESEGIQNATQPIVNTSTDDIRVQVEPLDQTELATVQAAIDGAVDATDISSQSIGPSWGEQIANRAITGLVVFLILLTLLIWGYFREWKMSVAAIVAVAHDVVITVGIYALSGFEVTPATVTGILTILGFSLYDTVVVFDKVRENTKNLARTRQTFREAANLAVNQTLVRSINTSIVALIPVGALLWVGAYVLGAGSLKDLSLSLFVGMAAGLFSSVFIATPLFVQLKEMEPGVKAGDSRAMKHRNRKQVDPFANVPAFSEDMAIHDDPGVEEDEVPGDAPRGNRPVPATPATKFTGESRPSARPVSDSTSSGRPQPERKPRSQRGKK